MSQENVEVAMRLYRALSGGAKILPPELTHTDIEWETSPNLPDGGVYRGREAVEAFLNEQLEAVWGGAIDVDVERSFDCGDDVLVFIRMRGRGLDSGIPLDVRIAQLVTVRGNKVARVKVFPDREQALEAVGGCGSNAPAASRQTR